MHLSSVNITYNVPQVLLFFLLLSVVHRSELPGAVSSPTKAALPAGHRAGTASYKLSPTNTNYPSCCPLFVVLLLLLLNLKYTLLLYQWRGRIIHVTTSPARGCQCYQR